MRVRPPFTLASAEGFSRGAKGALVEEAQNLLRRYGYLQVAPRQEGRAAFVTADRAASAVLGTFDDATAAAVKKYQEFYRLPATGVLDRETLAKLARPRCGVPDLPPARAKVASGKWNKQTILFRLNNHTPDLPQALTRNAVFSALLVWQGFTNLKLNEAKEKEKVDVNISFEAGDHGDGNPFDGPGWDTGFDSFTGIALGADVYVCAFRGGDATLCLHKITGGGAGFTQTYMSQI